MWFFNTRLDLWAEDVYAAGVLAWRIFSDFIENNVNKKKSKLLLKYHNFTKGTQPLYHKQLVVNSIEKEEILCNILNMAKFKRIGLTDLIGIDGLKMDYVGEAITPLNWVDFIYSDYTPEINENFRHNIDPYGDTSQVKKSLKSCAEYNTTKISNDVRRLELGRI
ncbi:hypothetical protein RCL_jg26351.t1 [Rhizophagus clarus]|uniref:Uncharacterized protein n=1 Tax=Rhizophagus clarus TaxID=94130 RepID=A0A8H3KX08_9GLOM|nr:hypothetical protein RCL_jg26351.t1 [Rhizophagus clarus]